MSSSEKEVEELKNKNAGKYIVLQKYECTIMFVSFPIWTSSRVSSTTGVLKLFY